FHNTTSLSDYCAAIDAGRLPLDCRRSHTLTRDDMIREAVLLQGILCNLHVDKRAIEKTWGIDFDRYFADENEELAGYQADGLCAIDGDGITVTGLGKSFARHIAFVFDRYYKQPRIEKSAD
ncbi:MAG: hypothetical protein JW795_20265, partial [Chitinivibrionales bacterium]|nr:hypothetical protein [Chitinivibrionales bacterium]